MKPKLHCKLESQVTLKRSLPKEVYPTFNGTNNTTVVVAVPAGTVGVVKFIDCDRCYNVLFKGSKYWRGFTHKEFHSFLEIA